MSLLVDDLIDSAKRNLALAKYWRGVGDKARAAERLAVATQRRKQAAQMLRGL